MVRSLSLLAFKVRVNSSTPFPIAHAHDISVNGTPLRGADLDVTQYRDAFVVESASLLEQTTISDPSPEECIVPSFETPKANHPVSPLSSQSWVTFQETAVSVNAVTVAVQRPSGDEKLDVPPPPPPEDWVGHFGSPAEPPNLKGGAVVLGYTTLGCPSTLNTALDTTPEVEDSPTTLIFANACPPFAMDLSGAPGLHDVDDSSLEESVTSPCWSQINCCKESVAAASKVYFLE